MVCRFNSVAETSGGSGTGKLTRGARGTYSSAQHVQLSSNALVNNHANKQRSCAGGGGSGGGGVGGSTMLVRRERRVRHCHGLGTRSAAAGAVAPLHSIRKPERSVSRKLKLHLPTTYCNEGHEVRATSTSWLRGIISTAVQFAGTRRYMVFGCMTNCWCR